jgi:CelD/BcsL family acetyltransferase involved in cellulose biosynthesis
VAGRPIAFHYGFTAGGIYSLIVTSYDEDFREFSPGHLLTEDLLKRCIDKRLEEFDFLGCDLPWKIEWTPSSRPYDWLYIFRNSLKGRFLHQLKFGWVRTARLLLTNAGS